MNPASDTDLLLPVQTKDFIRMLHHAHPHRVKLRGESEEDHQRYAGQRELIDEAISLWREHYGEDPIQQQPG